jgi:two-component system nitrogen regulation sensor histidine kinase GlnL
MKNNGVLTLTTKLDTDFQILSKKQKRPIRMLLVEIKDTGEGMSDVTMNKLFTPFFTTKSKGTGLGLCISQKILEEHQGGLKFVKDKKKGKGTTAKIYLPLKRK